MRLEDRDEPPDASVPVGEGVKGFELVVRRSDADDRVEVRLVVDPLLPVRHSRA